MCRALAGVLTMPMLACATGTWLNDHPANVVLGQPDFGSINSPLSASWFGYVSGVAVDPATGKVFIVDTASHRIMRFTSAAAMVTGSSAEAWFGQPTSTATAQLNPSAKTFNIPEQIHIDPAGRLWVADRENHRVLRFDNAATKPSYSDADGVLGQPNFIVSIGNRGGSVAANTLSVPSAVWHDGIGLWVADSGNNRVLGYSFPESKPNGGAADVVLGQPDFVHNAAGATAATMNSPGGVVVGNGTMFVGDTKNGRVLRFDGADLKGNGAPSDGYLGSYGPPSATTMNTPLAVALDGTGRLYVSDSQSNRVLIFLDAAHKPNGAPADTVLGQPDFTSYAKNGNGVGEKNLSAPSGLAYDSAANVLWVGEYYNSRAMRYSPLVGLLDVDASGNATKFDALTDGLLVIRYLFGLIGTSLTRGALGVTATRTTPVAVKAYLDGVRAALDVDNDGNMDALTDGLMILRYLFGLRGAPLTDNAVATGALRPDAAAIEPYLKALVQ